MRSNKVLENLKRLKAIADVGLLYCTNEYDKERYGELQEISFRLLKDATGHSQQKLLEVFPAVKDYPTAKVDVRALVLSEDQKILLVQESADGLWALPGGWGEIGFSPAETAVKECKEETGLDVIAENLLAVFDKRKHNHPPQPFYVYKMIFYCKPITNDLSKGFDVLDVDYFAANKLPPLSENRILKEQIELLYTKVIASDFVPYFD
jgi:ADP-ribose pyrophosphatase YjhB (NUDIX family)